MARRRLGKRIVGGSLVAGLLSKGLTIREDPDRLKDLAPHVLADAGLTDVDAEFEQFARARASFPTGRDLFSRGRGW